MERVVRFLQRGKWLSITSSVSDNGRIGGYMRSQYSGDGGGGGGEAGFAPTTHRGRRITASETVPSPHLNVKHERKSPAAH